VEQKSRGPSSVGNRASGTLNKKKNTKGKVCRPDVRAHERPDALVPTGKLGERARSDYCDRSKEGRNPSRLTP